nr:hypothetical protein [uncultured Sphingobacterium sp.]
MAGLREGSMEKKLGCLLVSVIGLMVISACHTAKQKRSEEQHTSIKRMNGQVVDFSYKKQDSLFRTWYVWTDSGFRFHPDSGLIGRAGGLIAQESSTSTTQKNQFEADVARESNQSDSERKYNHTRSTPIGRFAIAAMALIIAIWFLYNKKGKT